MASQAYRILIKAKDQASGAFKKVGGAAKTAGGAVAGVGKAALGATVAIAALGTAVALAAKHSFDFADKIGKVATRTGLATSTVQAFQIAAIESGSTMDIANKSLEKFTRSVGDAARGLKTQADIFKDLGVNVRDSNGNVKDMDTLLREVADGFSGLSSNAEKATAAANLFGRAGIQIADVLDNGAEAFDEYLRKAEEYGLILGEEGIRKSEKFNDTLALLKRQFMVIKTVIAIAFLPILQTVATKISETTSEFATQEGSVEDLGVAIRDNLIAGFIDALRALASFSEGIEEMVRFFRISMVQMNLLGARTRMLAADANNLFSTIGIDGINFIEDAAAKGITNLDELEKHIISYAQELGHSVTTIEEIVALANVFDEGTIEGFAKFGKIVSLLSPENAKATQSILDLANSVTELKTELDTLTREAVTGENTWAGSLNEIIDQIEGNLESILKGEVSLPELLKNFAKADEVGATGMKNLLDAMERLKQTFESAEARQQQWKTVWAKTFDQAADALTNFVETGKLQFKDFVQSLLRDIVRLQIRMQMAKIFGFFADPIKEPKVIGPGGLSTTNYDGGGYTGMGARAGGLDGKGGFLAMLHPQETVLDHTKGQGGVIINQTVSFATGVQDTVRNEVLQLLPDIAESSKGAVFEAMGRGGAFRRGMS